MTLNRKFRVDTLRVEVYSDRRAMGEAAAQRVAESIAAAQADHGWANVIFAAAPSQNEMLARLCELPVDWEHVRAFHMDEYVGLPAGAPQRFGQWLKDRIFDIVKPAEVHLLEPSADEPAKSAEAYAAKLRAHPVDVVCCGIGENAHIAFNDPLLANFSDPYLVKIVELELPSRQQQVNDGSFATLDDVPTHALTLTVPALTAAKAVHCVVPGTTKAEAVRTMLRGPITSLCPASVLRQHAGAILYLDPAASTLI